MAKRLDDDYPHKPYIPADAVAKEARPGYKAGNPLLDSVLDNIRRDTIIRRCKELYSKIFKRE